VSHYLSGRIAPKILESALKKVPGSPMVEFMILQDGVQFRNYISSLTGYFEVKINNDLFEDFEIVSDPTEDKTWNGAKVVSMNTVLNILSLVTSNYVTILLSEYTVSLYSEGEEVVKVDCLSTQFKKIKLPTDYGYVLRASAAQVFTKIKIVRKLSNELNFDLSETELILSAKTKDKTSKSNFDLSKLGSAEYSGGHRQNIQIDAAQHLDAMMPLLKDHTIQINFKENFLKIEFETKTGPTGFFLLATLARLRN
jgi:hypothetical protein